MKLRMAFSARLNAVTFYTEDLVVAVELLSVLAELMVYLIVLRRNSMKEQQICTHHSEKHVMNYTLQ